MSSVRVHACMCVQMDEAYEKVHTRGCIEAVLSKANSNLYVIGGVAIGLSVPQVRTSVSYAVNLFTRVFTFVECTTWGLHLYNLLERDDVLSR